MSRGMGGNEEGERKEGNIWEILVLILNGKGEQK